ncbi:MAG TPA: hypothetical protein GXX14_05000 [Clostridiaceae bacterium]|nr:hypothetical protein [Clostridiaceae bacterium]
MKVFFRILIILLVIMIIAGLIITYIYIPDLKFLERYYENNGQEPQEQEPDEIAGEKADTNEPSPEDAGEGDPKKTGDNGEPSGETGDRRMEGSYLSVDEINFFQKISLMDKLKVLSVISRLKKEDIDAILRMVSGGITYAEMDKIREILEERLGEKDVCMLENLINKNKELYSVWKENHD